MVPSSFGGGLQWKLIAKLVVVVFVPAVIFSITFSSFRFRFYDGQFGWYEANKVFARQDTKSPRILFVGDSTGKTSWKPALLSDDSYNYALGAASIYETYFDLRDYLAHHEAPEYVIYTAIPNHILGIGALWTRGVYFHRVAPSSMVELVTELEAHGETTQILGMPMDESLSDIALFAMFSPLKYRDAFLHGIESDKRYMANVESFDKVRSEDGWGMYGTAQEVAEANVGITGLTAFEPSETAIHYVRKLIELCESHGIRFIYQAPWVNESTMAGLNPDFVRDWEGFFAKLKDEYPSITVHCTLEGHPANCFGDGAHLNLHGIKSFCEAMRERYPQVFGVDAV